MNRLRNLPATAALALLLAGSPAMAEPEQQPPPQLVPTRDVDIIYDVMRPQRQQQKSSQRVRWSAGEHLERVDGPDKSTTIFDRDGQRCHAVEPGDADIPQAGGRAAPADRTGTGNEAPTRTTSRHRRIALHRLVMVGRRRNAHGLRHCGRRAASPYRRRPNRDQARSVKYGPQKAELFQVPPNYTPALAPEGEAEPVANPPRLPPLISVSAEPQSRPKSGAILTRGTTTAEKLPLY